MSTSASDDHRYKRRGRSEAGWVLDQELYCIQSGRMMLECQLYQQSLGMHAARMKVGRLNSGVRSQESRVRSQESGVGTRACTWKDLCHELSRKLETLGPGPPLGINRCENPIIFSIAFSLPTNVHLPLSFPHQLYSFYRLCDFYYCKFSLSSHCNSSACDLYLRRVLVHPLTLSIPLLHSLDS